MGQKATVSYNLKPTTGKLNIHEEKYTPELRQYVQDKLTEELYYFGYVKPKGQENETGYFEFDEDTPENMANFKKFASDTELARKKVCVDGYTSERLYEHNKGT